MIYLDNAATTWPKPASVLKEMNRCSKHYAANPGRGGYDMASRAGEAVYKCRCAVCDLVGLDNPENVIFTSNATHALNIAIKGTVRSGGHVIITSVEHNSVLRPVHSLGASYDIARADIFGYVSADEVERLIRDNTCLIVCTLASNVCGSVQPFEKIAAIAKKHSIPFLLDASQGLGAVNVDMNKMNIDMLASTALRVRASCALAVSIFLCRSPRAERGAIPKSRSSRLNCPTGWRAERSMSLA